MEMAFIRSIRGTLMVDTPILERETRVAIPRVAKVMLPRNIMVAP